MAQTKRERDLAAWKHATLQYTQGLLEEAEEDIKAVWRQEPGQACSAACEGALADIASALRNLAAAEELF